MPTPSSIPVQGADSLGAMIMVEHGKRRRGRGRETRWSYRRSPVYGDVVIATPLVHDNHLFSTVGFGQGCDLTVLVPGTESIGVKRF